MLSAGRVQQSCSSCRAQLLHLFENGFANATARPQRLTSARAPPRVSAPISRSISTTKPRHQEVQADLATADSTPLASGNSADIELVVRQAKHQFGNTLPKGYLSGEELKLYTRYYGAPLRETRPEDVGMPVDHALLRETHKYVVLKNKGMLLRENEEGELEEVAYQVPQLPPSEIPVNEEDLDSPALEMVDESDLPSEDGLEYIKAIAKNKREFEALMKLQKDFEKASLLPEEQDGIEEDEEPAEEEEEDIIEEEEGVEEDEMEEEPGAQFEEGVVERDRAHHYSELGQWRTTPSTLHLPKAEFVEPINKLLGRTDLKHIREAAEKAFGGPGLPHSVATPNSGKNAGQVPIPLEAGHTKMSEIEADTFLSTILPGTYASTMGILVELRKRMGPYWLQNLLSRNRNEGPRVLDVGSGGGGLAAWDKVLQTEWELLHGTTGRAAMGPPGKKTVIVGNEHLRHRISRFLHNTTFLPRLPDYLHSGTHPQKMDDSELPVSRKTYDVIILSHQLMPLREGYQRRALIDNLWEMLSPEGGILIVLEKGHPRGFEAVADVRQRLLDEFIECSASDPQPESFEPEARRVREPGMIIAPCTNHKQCPMYLTPGLSHGRKDFCHFSQRFIRPPFLQKIHNALHRNHEDIDYSFVAIQRGVTPSSPSPLANQYGESAIDLAFKGYEHAPKPPNPLSLPRTVLPPLKRTGHVTFDLCTPAGTLERWTVPKSFSKQAYRDARKARWGDLWALGAKTRVARPVRLGRGGVAPDDGGVRARRAAEAAKGKGRKVVNLEADSGGIYKATEKGRANLIGGRGHAPAERRTKGGKKPQQRKVREKDLMEDF